MVSFASDYTTGAHPEILRALVRTNLESLPGYGTDFYCERAKDKIRRACGRPDARVEFLVGGTQTNSVIISSMLRDYEGVIAAKTGHIATHEAGAIEYAGHKVLELPDMRADCQAGKDETGRTDEDRAEADGADADRAEAGRTDAGKIDAGALEAYVSSFYSDANREHMVFPGMVYISHPTEYGTLYTKKELEALHDVCIRYGMTLYLDGARLGYGLMSRQTDVTLRDLARLCDVFYIGGTKVGALCGEAVVFTHSNRPPHFMNSVKKRGALLAKGRLLGIQFDTLFSLPGELDAGGPPGEETFPGEMYGLSDGTFSAGDMEAVDVTDTLYGRIGRQAIDMAEEMKQIFREKGMRFFLESPTNQQFLILQDGQMENLRDKVTFSFWERYDDSHTVVRLATSWSTTEEDLRQLREALEGPEKSETR